MFNEAVMKDKPLNTFTMFHDVRDHPETNIYDIGVYAVLLSHRNSKSRQCNPRVETVAKECNCSPPPVKNAILHLESLNLIEVDRSKKTHSYTFQDDIQERLEKILHKTWFRDKDDT